MTNAHGPANLQTIIIKCTFVCDWPDSMSENQINNPLHGKTLEVIVKSLVDFYGFEKLGTMIRIKCFIDNPGIQSSLKFLRKTEWARKKVEDLYIRTFK